MSEITAEKLTPRRLTKREVAERIAKELFTNGAGELADRLVLTAKGGAPSDDLGGWCYDGVVKEVEKILDDCLE